METPYSADFEKNVFINCPFDDDYTRLLHPLLFTILYLGFNPRIATERSSANEPRIDKIFDLIGSSKYSIHDISRLQATTENEFYRLNMSFELGIDYGCRRFATNHHRDKKFLVLEKEQYRYAQALSDLAGMDIKNHNDKPFEIIQIARNWLASFSNGKTAKAPTFIHKEFNDFMEKFAQEREQEGFSPDDIKKMPVSDFIAYIRRSLNPLAPNLGSTATITGGSFRNTSSNLPGYSIKEYIFSVISGEITHNKNGKIIGNIKIRSPIASEQKLIEEKGLDKIDFISEESIISNDSSKQTVFTFSSPHTYPQIAMFLGVISVPMQDIKLYDLETTLKGYLKKDDLQNLTLEGTFDAVWKNNLPKGSYETSGEFKVDLIKKI